MVDLKISNFGDPKPETSDLSESLADTILRHFE